MNHKKFCRIGPHFQINDLGGPSCVICQHQKMSVIIDRPQEAKKQPRK